MKKSQIIDLLNKDLTGEIEAILIYMRDSFVTPSAGRAGRWKKSQRMRCGILRNFPR